MTLIFKSVLFLGLILTTYIVSAQPVKQDGGSAHEEILFREHGQPVVLTCARADDPNQGGIRTWLRNGTPLEDGKMTPEIKFLDDKSLLVLQPSPAVEGVYQCFTETHKGIATSPKFSVKQTYLKAPETTPSVNIKPAKGLPFSLDCDVPEGYPKPEVQWFLQHGKDHTLIEAIINKRITQAPNGALYFSNATTEDVNVGDFRYVCMARNDAVDLPVVVSEAVITGLSSEGGNEGRLVEQYVSKEVRAVAGETTALFCIFGGTPLAHPDWTKDGKNVNGAPGDRVTRHNRSSGRRLIIKNTTLEDAGTYQCAVDNGFGTELRSIKVTVQAKPSIKTANEVAAKLGEEVKICEVNGVPTPKLTITHNAKPLVASNNVVITNDRVVIKNIQPTDQGYYGCEAVNELGGEFRETYLSIA
ncbi:hemolin [Plutella xylostella]|uniref:hemolin n=1 Tax=Plutella xylostella TaxID=51655 RepID=UPI002032605E|nr:hemolin [Plutella xylostella]